MTKFSEYVPVVKQHMTVYASTWTTSKYYSKRKKSDGKYDLLHNSIRNFREDKYIEIESTRIIAWG